MAPQAPEEKFVNTPTQTLFASSPAQSQVMTQAYYPPGTWCTLATSKPTTFLKDDGYDYISTGITGPSQHRQDFLVVGKERNRILGLLVLPCVMSVNCNEELLVLANACYPPIAYSSQNPYSYCHSIAYGNYGPMPPRCFPVTPENPEVLWVQHISEQRPMLTFGVPLPEGFDNVTFDKFTGRMMIITYPQLPAKDTKLILTILKLINLTSKS
ncbi:hypothetical protein DUI87_27181 [Hirundo rustica rustica]|uniref:Uncharacterized protein n=1 Tax=Hirundo rustica rustica TaxID=333673 RepID=A0A3M0JN80_HIRRU|nr:hypothetical protein DUI87_27181 [Hirundo rustica rustica]